jgi:uncharacterized membrane protein required for colicin V production
MDFLNNLPVGWFDGVVLAVIVTGLLRGRKHGMSEELLSVLKWAAIAFGCSATYKTLGLYISQTSTFGLLLSNITAYLIEALVITLVFGLLKRAIGGKLIGSNAFGQGEYYLGMVAGMIRFTCGLIAVLALLNARSYSQAEVTADLKYQQKEYGSDFFPGFHSVQQQVFEKSLTGPWIRDNLAFLLITPTSPGGGKPLKRAQLDLP